MSLTSPHHALLQVGAEAAVTPVKLNIDIMTDELIDDENRQGILRNESWFCSNSTCLCFFSQ